MESQAEIETQLAAINERLNSGISRVRTDGTETEVKLDDLRRQRDYLLRKLRIRKARRPAASRIDLGGF